jgi:hypothetical protein
LAPAFGATYFYKPDSVLVSKHKMSINGALEHIQTGDVLKIADRFDIANLADMIEQVNSVVVNWRAYARQTNVGESRIEKRAADHQPIEFVSGAGQTIRRLTR